MRGAFLIFALASLAAGFAAPVFADEIHDLIKNDAGEKALHLLETNSAVMSERDDKGRTPLHLAGEYSRTNVVKWLLKHHVDVNAKAYNDYTPLFLTTNGAISKMLLRAGANRDARDAWGRTPLQHAAQLQRTEVVTAILDSGCPLDLVSALMLNRRDDAKKLIRRKPDQVKNPVADSDMWGNTTPLGIAAGNGDAEMVQLLIAAGAPINAATQCPNIGGMTALCNAVWGGHYEVAELLCKAGADCNVTGGKFYPHLLDFARTHSDDKMVQLLVQYGAKSGKE